MTPRPEPEEYITLEGEDYNAIRRAEALAREEFCRPENRERRRQHFETLFPQSKDGPIRLVEPEGPRPVVIP
jgi:hypothetical protein